MQRQTSLLDALSDEVHCSVCLDIFIEPQALQCLHTFCRSCLQPLVKKSKITCPICRTFTKKDKVVGNHQVKRLAEIYSFEHQEQQTSSSDTTLSKSNCDSDILCHFCRQSNPYYACKACLTFFCTTCQLKHQNEKGCERENVEMAPANTGKVIHGVNLYKNFGIKSQAPVSGWIKDLLVYGDKLLALVDGGMNPTLVELDKFGREISTICQDGLGHTVFGAAVTGVGEIIVASSRGLLTVTLDGLIQVISDSADQHYHHCCAGRDGTVYATGARQWFAPVFVEMIQNGLIVYRIETQVMDRMLMTCAVGTDPNILYICSAHEHTIYEISLPGGHILSTWGRFGSFSPGGIIEPRLCASINGDLVVIDRGNHVIQIFNTRSQSWHVLAIASHEQPKHPCAAVAQGNNVYVAGFSVNFMKYLYVLENS